MQHRRAIIAIPGLAALVALYALLGFYWAPRFVQSRITEVSAREYGQPAGASDESWRDRKTYLDRLVALYRAQTGSRPDVPRPPRPADGEAPVDPIGHAIAFLEPQLKAAVTVSEDELAALGPARAEAVRDVLLGDGSIDPARLFVIWGWAPELADGAVRMTLSLK